MIFSITASYEFNLIGLDHNGQNCESMNKDRGNLYMIWRRMIISKITINPKE